MLSALGVKQLYERRIDQYANFIGFFRSRRGIQKLLEQSGVLRPRMKVLDAGCGFGTASFALLGALEARGVTAAQIHAFDLTPAMLRRFQAELDASGIHSVALREANVLDDDALPPDWTGYDFVVSTSMLEYLPRHQLPHALRALRARMAPQAVLLVVITKKTPMTKVLIEWAWRAERYAPRELQEAFGQAGFDQLRFTRFPWRYGWLNQSNHVVVARRGA